jgi:hypothetical protein
MGHKFIIDLTILDLSANQISSIESAIEKAVSTQLSEIDLINDIKFIPLEKTRDFGDHTSGFRSISL